MSFVPAEPAVNILGDLRASGLMVRSREFGAGDVVFRQGDSVGSIFIVVSGVIKMAYVSRDGGETVKGFAAEGVFFTSLAAVTIGVASTFTAVAVTAVACGDVSFDALQRLAGMDGRWERRLRLAIQHYAVEKEQREWSLLMRTPEERYLDFRAQHRGIEARVSQKDIARYLGVTPVTLSRIRSRLGLAQPRSARGDRVRPGPAP